MRTITIDGINYALKEYGLNNLPDLSEVLYSVKGKTLSPDDAEDIIKCIIKRKLDDV